MNIDNLISALKLNGIKVHSQFARACKNTGCISAYKEVFDDLLDSLSKYVYYGSNSKQGFKHIKDEITKITGLVVKISKQSTASDIKEITKEAENLKKNAEKEIIPLKEGEVDMKNEVIKRIDAYKDGVEVLMNVDMAEDRRPILTESLVKLEQIKSEMNNIIDSTSPEAYQYAKSIVDGLKVWADEVAKFNHNDNTNKILDKAVSDAKSWNTVNKTKSGIFGIRKKVNIDEIRFESEDFDKCDLLTQTANSKEYVTRTSNFIKNIADYERLIKARYDNEKNEQALAEYNKRVEEIEAEKTALKNKYANGEISREEVGDIAAELKDELDELNDDIYDVKEKIADNREGFKGHKYVFDTLESLLSTINHYRATADLNMVTFIGQYIDFDALYNLMHGTASREDDNSIRALRQVEAVIEAHNRGAMNRFRDQMRAEESVRRQQKREEREARRAINRNERESRNAARNSSAADWLLGEEKNENKPQTEKEENAEEKLDDLNDILR